MKTSEAQRRAIRKYQAKMDPDVRRHKAYQRTARMFVKKHATDEELDELEALMKIRREENKNNG